MKAAVAAVVLASVSMLAGGEAQAGAVQIASAAGLNTGDTTLAYTGTLDQSFSGPVSYGAGANTLTFSDAGKQLALEEVGTTVSNSAFPTGTVVMYGAGYFGATAPMTISFLTGVTEVGLNAEEFDFGSYVISFTAYDGATALGTFNASGTTPTTLSFVGVLATGNDVITSLVISDNAGGNVGLGPVTFGNSGTVVIGVAEPASVALLGAGVLGLGLLVRPWPKRLRRRIGERSR